MQRRIDEAQSQLPPQTDAVTWARMLVAARDVDNVGTHDFSDRPTLARRKLLLPVARALYEEKVLPTATAESERIEAIIAHCGPLLETAEARNSSAFRQGTKESWNEEQCLEAIKQLSIPTNFYTLRPAPPDVVGVNLTPTLPAWRPLRRAIFEGFSDAEKGLQHAFSVLLFNAIRFKNFRPVQLLDSVRFDDHVFRRAPPLVRALPQRWTSEELSNELLEALLALLKVVNTRPLIELVEKLSEDEYALVVQERDCLSQLLDSGMWAPNCDNGRKFDDYVTLLRFMGQDARLEPVPKRLGRPKLSCAALYSPQADLQGSTAMLQAPPQTDTAAWACMLAAARGADEMDALDTQADPLSISRLETLLPIARALYDEHVFRTAKIESEQIDAIIMHCRKFLERKECKRKAFKQSAVEPWTKETCLKEMELLLVPFTLKTLRPVSSAVIGVRMIPQSPVWGLLNQAMYAGLSKAERLANRAFRTHVHNAINDELLEQSKVEPLRGVRLVDTVLDCAPPLVRAQPRGWTSGGLSNELIEAFHGLLKVLTTRPLAELVSQLSDCEYALLVKEHACLSQLLEKGTWKSSCANGRQVDEYVAFVGFLRQDGNFRGKLADVPQNRRTAKPIARKPSKRPRPKPESARKRQRLDEGVRKVTRVQGILDGKLPLVDNSPHGLEGPLNLGKLFDLGVDTDSHDELDDEYLREQLDTVVFDSVEWSRNLPQLPNDFGGNYTFLESEQGNSAGGKLERPASLGAMSRSDGATVIPLVAAAALGLFVLAMVFRLRARRAVGRRF